MKKIFTLYWKPVSAALLLAITATIVTFFVDYLYEDKYLSLETLNSVISITTALLLFGIAWTVHQRYNASQQSIDKKADKVYGLIASLQSVSLTILHNEVGQKKEKNIFNIRPTRTKQHTRIDEILSLKNNKHYFHPNILDIYEDLVAQSTDIFMPVHIANEIKDKFDITNMFSIDVENYDIKKHDTIVCASKVPRSRISLYTDTIKNRQQVPKKVITKYNGNDVCADDLIKKLYEIHEKSVEWLKKNARYAFDDLNIDNNTN
jgi:hypothetical protein